MGAGKREGLLALVARIGDIAAARGAGTGMLTTAKLREMRHPDWSSSSEAQPPAAIWQPGITLDQGFATTIAWYRDRGWL